MVTHVSHLLSFVADIHIARHVDIDGIRQVGDAVDDMYAQTLLQARIHVRTLETATQAVYDDSSSLLLTSQVIPPFDPSVNPEDRAASLNLLESISSSLRSNLAVVRETLETLMAIGHEQSDLSQGDYNGSIEWRMSRLGMVHSQLGGAERTSPGTLIENDIDQGDVVDLPGVFNRPVPPPKPPRQPFDTSINALLPSEHVNAPEGNDVPGENEVDTIDECEFC